MKGQIPTSQEKLAPFIRDCSMVIECQVSSMHKHAQTTRCQHTLRFELMLVDPSASASSMDLESPRVLLMFVHPLSMGLI